MSTEQSGLEDLARAATYGGVGWQARRATHAEEVAAGERWRACGIDNEIGKLREVLLSWPSEHFATAGDPDRWLLLQWPDLSRLRGQAEALADFYRGQGVEVHLHRPSQPPPPNYLFLRDLAFMTPEGAILARPAAACRAGEERFAAVALAELGIPMLRCLRGGAHFEGADALWLDPETVLVGVGRRTNAEGLAQITAALTEQAVRVEPVRLPAGVQHLLGLVVFVDIDLALVDRDRAPDALKHLLLARGVELLELPADEELLRQRAMNVVVLSPRRLVMPAGCRQTRARLERRELEVHVVEMDEYLKAAGAMGCATLPLRRECRRPAAS